MAYPVTGILIDAGCTLQEVLDLRSKAKAEIMAGAVEVTQWRTGGNSATRFRGISAERMIEECNHALSILDPENHGGDIVPPMTRAVFG